MATKQRRPLTDEELADAMRLRALLRQKKEDDGLTQEAVGHLCGWAGQQAVQAFVSGNTALNLDAAFRFSKALGVPLDAISPRLAAKAVELFGATIAGRERPRTFEELLTHFAPEIEQLRLTDTGRRALAGLVNAYEQDPAAGDRLSKALLALVGQE
ncbi:MAG: helix-turn-helix transcriptional regulator [Thauera sp.]|jgi:transcriptional regulator with XRE-family HTH domain|nr:helix-turn-helix transcriptional regulator [Thauera sp.]